MVRQPLRMRWQAAYPRPNIHALARHNAHRHPQNILNRGPSFRYFSQRGSKVVCFPRSGGRGWGDGFHLSPAEASHRGVMRIQQAEMGDPEEPSRAGPRPAPHGPGNAGKGHLPDGSGMVRRNASGPTCHLRLTAISPDPARLSPDCRDGTCHMPSFSLWRNYGRLSPPAHSCQGQHSSFCRRQFNSCQPIVDTT